MTTSHIVFLVFCGFACSCSSKQASGPADMVAGGGGDAGAGGGGGGGGSDPGGAGTGDMGGGQLPTPFDPSAPLGAKYVGNTQIYVSFRHAAAGRAPGTATVIGPCILSNLPDGAMRFYAGTVTITD